MLLTAPLPACLAATADATLEASPASSQDDGHVLYLQVILNQTDTGTLARFVQTRGRLAASVATLRDIGFTLPGRPPDEVLELDQLPGVSVRYQADLQRLDFNAALSELSLDTTVLRPQEEVAPSAASSPGVLLNYEVFASHDRDLSNLTTSAELRAFGLGDGVLSSTSVVRLYHASDTPGWQSQPVRLDTTWRLDLPEQAVSMEVGDFYSDNLSWTRSVRMAGIQVGRNYGLQPYKVITPLPAFVGEATVPSTIELYIDGLRQYSGQVAAGPFQLSTLPGVNGNGTAQVVVTDAFGQVRTLDFSFYGTQQLLAKGLSEGGAGLGVLRRSYGVHSFEYDHTPVATGTLRYGISDAFTAQGHAESGGGLINGGGGGTWLLGSAGLLSAAYARSRLHGDQGGQWAVDYSWNSHRYNVSAGSQRAQGAYRDIGALQDNLPVRASDHVVAGVSLPRAGAFSASYVRLSIDGQGTSRYGGLFWSQSFGRSWTANLSANQNLSNPSDRSVYLSVSLSLDQLRRGSLSVQHSGGRTSFVADASRAMPGSGGPDGMGWRLQARSGRGGDGQGGLAEIGWQNDIGRYVLGVAGQAGAAYRYGSARGSLAWLGEQIMPARSVDGAFTVVDTGVPDVPVRLENRLVGRTNAYGHLLVTPLQPWQRNHVGIDTLSMPANLRIDAVERMVTPRAGAGTLVRFEIAPTHAAMLILVDTDGTPLPTGTRVLRDGHATPVIVGHDGEVYLEDLQTENPLIIEGPRGRCLLVVAHTQTGLQPERIGPLTCTPETLP